MDESIINALAVLVTGTAGFIHLYNVSKPFNVLRTVLFIILLSTFIYGAFLQYEFFNLSELNLQIGLILFLLIIFSVYSYNMFQYILYLITKKFFSKKEQKD